MIRVGLIGFGRTGKEVACELFDDEAVKLVCVFKYHDTHEVGKEVGPLIGREADGVKMSLCEDYEKVLNESKPDVIIDFAAKQSILRYLEPTVRQGANLVVCSTGYDEIQLEKFKRHTDRIGIVWAPNVTDGINILSSLSKMVKSGWPDADISVIETHHSAKKDISGTALKLTEDLRDTEHIKIGRDGDSTRVENEIVIHKLRLGGVIGRHEFIFGNPYQTITLTHETISRRAFGSGAIRAARWIHKKKGFYSMDHVIGLEK